MLKEILTQLGAVSGAMDRQTTVQKTANPDHKFFLRFAITPFVLMQSLLGDLAEKLEESEDLEALKAFIGILPKQELYLSCPVNVITEGLALPNTGKCMILVGADEKDKGGTVIAYNAQLVTIGVEKYLSLPQAATAADELSKAMTEELGIPVTVNLAAHIASRQISTAQNAQRKDAKATRAAKKGGYQPAQRGNTARGVSDNESPAFAGTSGVNTGDDEPDLSGL